MRRMMAALPAEAEALQQRAERRRGREAVDAHQAAAAKFESVVRLATAASTAGGGPTAGSAAAAAAAAAAAGALPDAHFGLAESLQAGLVGGRPVGVGEGKGLGAGWGGSGVTAVSRRCRGHGGDVRPPLQASNGTVLASGTETRLPACPPACPPCSTGTDTGIWLLGVCLLCRTGGRRSRRSASPCPTSSCHRRWRRRRRSRLRPCLPAPWQPMAWCWRGGSCGWMRQ